MSLQKQFEELKLNLHQWSEETANLYDNLVFQYAEQIEPKVTGMNVGEMAQFLTTT